MNNKTNRDSEISRQFKQANFMPSRKVYPLSSFRAEFSPVTFVEFSSEERGFYWKSILEDTPCQR